MASKKVRGDAICTSCGMVGKGRRVVEGSVLIELVLWCFFLVPGLIYSIWRLTTAHYPCRNCKQDSLIPLQSPMGRQLRSQTGPPVGYAEQMDAAERSYRTDSEPFAPPVERFESLRTCPRCAEQVQAGATGCRFCGIDLDPVPPAVLVWGIAPDAGARLHSDYPAILPEVVAEVGRRPLSHQSTVDEPLLRWLCELVDLGHSQDVDLDVVLASRVPPGELDGR